MELSQGLISVPGIRQIKYIKRGCHTKAGNQKRHFVYNLFFFCFVKVMENKTDIASYFSIVMKVDVWLRICLHGKDAAKMF